MEAGFLQTLLDRAPSGLDSFGSEDNEPEPSTADEAIARDWDLEDESFPNTTGGLMPSPSSRPDRASSLTLGLSGALEYQHPESAIPPPTPRIESVFHRAGRRIRATKSLVSGSFLSAGRAVGSALRWPRACLDPRVAMVIALALVGLAEAGWIGVQVSKGPKLTLFRTTVKVAETAEVAPSENVTGTSGSANRVTVRTTPAATPPPELQDSRLGGHHRTLAGSDCRARASDRRELEWRRASATGAPHSSDPESSRRHRCGADPRHPRRQRDVAGRRFPQVRSAKEGSRLRVVALWRLSLKTQRHRLSARRSECSRPEHGTWSLNSSLAGGGAYPV